jgi:3'5'-cyclic nucleotide phosphodiesterase
MPLLKVKEAQIKQKSILQLSASFATTFPTLPVCIAKTLSIIVSTDLIGADFPITLSPTNKSCLHVIVEHACHVTMAVDKFMKRIVNPDIDLEGDGSNFASHLHDYTHGINSDPLTLFAIVFSALIHDVDHRGVSNVQLAKEEEEMATMYHNKSIAEQNSLDIAWNLLMEPEYSDLRSYLFLTEKDLLRFRQVIVNVVLATDIFDKVSFYLGIKCATQHVL